MDKEGKCGGKRGYKESNGMEAEGSNQLLPAARRKGHGEVVLGEEDWTDRGGCVSEMRGERADPWPTYIVFRCRKVRRVRDERGSRKWVRENGMRWDSWDAFALKKCVRMGESGRVDDGGLERALGFDGGVLRGRAKLSVWFETG